MSASDILPALKGGASHACTAARLVGCLQVCSPPSRAGLEPPPATRVATGGVLAVPHRRYSSPRPVLVWRFGSAGVDPRPPWTRSYLCRTAWWPGACCFVPTWGTSRFRGGRTLEPPVSSRRQLDAVSIRLDEVRDTPGERQASPWGESKRRRALYPRPEGRGFSALHRPHKVA